MANFTLFHMTIFAGKTHDLDRGYNGPMMQFRLRTLLIVLALGPMVLALMLTGLVIPLVEQYLDERPVVKGTAFAPGIGDILVDPPEQDLEYGPLIRP